MDPKGGSSTNVVQANPQLSLDVLVDFVVRRNKHWTPLGPQVGRRRGG